MILFAAIVALSQPRLQVEDLPIHGTPMPAFSEVDDAMLAWLRETHLPGAACAIVRHGKLLFARGYGYADREKRTPFLPETTCRIASTSKPITAVAVMKLVEAGKLTLDDSALKLSGLKPFLPPGRELDPRVAKITIRDVLRHRTGFADIYWQTTGKYKEMGLPSPLSRDQIVQYVLGTPMLNSPGDKYIYDNTNFCWLARIIEQVSGESYEKFVKENVWAVAGVSDAFTVKPRDIRAKGEATYYDLPDRREPSVFPEDGGKLLPKSYGGGIDYSAVSGAGGWVCSAVDLGKFVSALEGTRKSLLSARSLSEIAARPTGESGNWWYGLGFEIATEGHTDGVLFAHSGGMSGACSQMRSRWDGSRFLIVANGDNDKGDLAGKIVQPVMDAINRVAVNNAWPDRNLFPLFEGR